MFSYPTLQLVVLLPRLNRRQRNLQPQAVAELERLEPVEREAPVKIALFANLLEALEQAPLSAGFVQIFAVWERRFGPGLFVVVR